MAPFLHVKRAKEFDMMNDMCFWCYQKKKFNVQFFVESDSLYLQFKFQGCKLKVRSIASAH
jgi:hypothetical protein